MSPFSELLGKALKIRGIRGYQLADLSGCSRGAVSEANTGKDAPRDEIARKWAEILSVPEKDMEGWLDAAAAQRARRVDIPARGSESRMAHRIEHLERMERSLATIAEALVSELIDDERARDDIIAFIRSDVAMLQDEESVRTALVNVLHGRPL